jgi:hypothetical protein
MPTTSELLTEARKAYHELMIGNQAVEVRDSNGESVRFTRANAERLRGYIKELEVQLAQENGTAERRRPMRLQF